MTEPLALHEQRHGRRAVEFADHHVHVSSQRAEYSSTKQVLNVQYYLYIKVEGKAGAIPNRPIVFWKYASQVFIFQRGSYVRHRCFWPQKSWVFNRILHIAFFSHVQEETGYLTVSESPVQFNGKHLPMFESADQIARYWPRGVSTKILLLCR
uniref:Uncharacterized protein n=1 Tax=mine drainage metagenome TaxID=410659 RepID=E6QFM2_9ZZZZ